jgi:hypothetical protein
LTGKVNVVQGHGLDILRYMDGVIQRDRDEGLYLKLALVAGDPQRWLTILFPDVFHDDREDVRDLLDDEGMINNSNVTLKFKETPDPAAAADILTGLLSNVSGVLRAEDTMGAGTGPFWTAGGD